MLATAADELKFTKWPQEDPKNARTIDVLSEIVSFSWSFDNKFVIFLECGGSPVIVSIKNMDSIQLIHKITAVNDATSVAFQRTTKRRVAIARISSNVAIYDTKEKEIEKLVALPQPAASMDFSATDTYLIVACHNGVIVLLNFPDGTVLCNFTVYAVPSFVSFHPLNEELFAVGTIEGSVFAYETDQEEPVYYTMLHDTEVFSVIYSPKSKNTLISASSKKFCVHNFRTKRCVFKGALPCSITCIDLTSDGEHFALSTESGVVYIYKTDEYDVPLFIWKAHPCKITILKFAVGYKIPIENPSEPIEPQPSTSSLDPIPSARERMLDDGGLTLFYEKYVQNADQDKSLEHLRDELVEKAYEVSRTIRLGFVAKMDVLTNYMNDEFLRMEQREEKKWDFMNGVLARARAKERAPKPFQRSEAKMRAPSELFVESMVNSAASVSFKTPEGSVQSGRSQKLLIERPAMSDISERTELSGCSSRSGWSGSPVRSVRSVASEKSKESIKGTRSARTVASEKYKESIKSTRSARTVASEKSKESVKAKSTRSEKLEGSMRTNKSDRESKCTAYYSNEGD